MRLRLSRWLLVAGWVWAAGSAAAQVSVSDGDTLTVDGQRIRLFGIDALEKKQTCRRGREVWACGAAAAAAVRELTQRNQIRCEPQDRDRYGRTVAICWAGEVDIGAELVRRGLAVAYVKYSDRYLQQEIEARKARAGIWATEFMQPDSWRASRN